MSLTINSSSTIGIKLTAAQNPVVVTGLGTIDTTGATALYGDNTASWLITNEGRLTGAKFGVETAKAGSVTSGSAGYISGGTAGVFINKGAATVVNDGTILGTGKGSFGVEFQLGGAVTNGLASSAALIRGLADGVWIAVKTGTVTNAGTIVATGTGGVGVLLSVGGNVTNGEGNTAASISGVAAGVSIKGTGNVVNTGGITASTGIGVYRVGIGSLVNGSSLITGATIQGGYEGVRLVASPKTAVNYLTNYGTITGGTNGVELQNGGQITNGSSGVVTARIAGALDGALVNGFGTVLNFGTIVGTGGATSSYGVNMMTGGQLVNGTATDTSAYIYGSFIGAQVHGGVATVQNYGTIVGGKWGVYTWLGGSLINGSLSDTRALISGATLGTWNTYPGQTIRNYATITSSAGSGVDLAAGGHPGAAGLLVNGTTADTVASISGAINGVTTVNKATVDNYGTMTGGSGFGCYVTAGGALNNGSAADTVALITGGTAGAGLKGAVMTLTNDGTIVGAMMGAALFTGGEICNGASNVTGALIRGGSGTGASVTGGTGTVVNDATITSVGGYGVSFSAGGTVTNGSTALTSASITGTMGVGLFANASTVVNDGTITSTTLAGVELQSGGLLTNGEAGVTGALISGYTSGVFGTGSAPSTTTIVNNGTITALGQGSFGIYLASGGLVTNGSPSATLASITGVASGVHAIRAAQVNNYGTITGGSAAGVYFVNAGSVVNGAAARIAGASQGVWVKASPGTVTNAGTIVATATAGVGIYMNQGGLVTDTAATALIEGGAVGIRLNASGTNTREVVNTGTIAGAVGIDFSVGGSSGTVINAGTIQGTNGDAVHFGSGNDLLVIDPGAVFQGLVDGGNGGNTIELAAGATEGSLSGLGTSFVNFATVTLDTGAQWELAGTDTVASLVANGTLEVAGNGDLVASAVDPSSAGVFQLETGATLEVGAMTGAGAAIQFLGASTLQVDTAASFGGNVGQGGYTGPLLQDFAAGDQVDLRNVTLAGTSIAYHAGSGLLQFSNGGAGVATLLFDTATLGSGTFHLGDDGTGHTLVTLG